MDADTANIEWLDLAPGLVPGSMRTAVLVRRAAFERNDAVVAALSAAKEAMHTAAMSSKPVDGLDKVLKVIALEQLAAELSAVPDVPPSADDDLRTSLRQRLGDVGELSPGHPPMVAAALRHYASHHAPAGHMPPVVTDADRASLEAFAQVSALSAEVVGNWDVVIANIGPGTSRASAVGAAAGLLPRLAEVRKAVKAMRTAVDAADGARQSAGLNLCPAHGEIRPLPPVAAGQSWSLDKAVRR